MAVREFLRRAGEEICIGDVDRKLAGDYTDRLLSADSGLKRKTVARRISSLSALWNWLEDRGLAPKDSNPWLRQLRGKRGKRGRETPRSQWKDAQLVKLLTGEMTPQYTAILHDLVKLALVTGARLNELCSLKTTDIDNRKDGCWIIIREGKTQAAVREVPIHPSATHVLERRRNTPDGFLFAGLVPGGPDRRQSWNVSKAFGRYCTKLGFTDGALVFHSLRKTFTEVMEAAAVPETTIKLLIGHTRSSLAYGGYSKGERVELRKVIGKLKYSHAVMDAIRRSEGAQAKFGTWKGGRKRNDESKVRTVVCVHAKDMKEPWCLAASTTTQTAKQLMTTYAKRWGIESGFRDTKDLRFGMGMASMRVSTPERRDRLWLLSAFAVVLLTLLGAAGEALGYDRHLKSNTSKQRTHSLFRQGAMLYELIPMMPEPRLRPLVERFGAMLLEIPAFASVYGTI